jgi:hypothetical protein
MRLERLGQMGLAEVACRGRQEVSKRWDRIGSRLGPRGVPRTDPRPTFEAFALAAPSRFFEGASSDAALALWLEGQKEAVAATLASAEAARLGRFRLMGHEVHLGVPLDWHREPLSGRRSPLLHWSAINPLDPSLVGDSKLVWELNRHQWLVALGQAYRATGDEAYAGAFCDFVTDWSQKNPPGMGINWSSSLEVSFRLIAWCWTLVLVRGSRSITAAFWRTIRGGLEAHARHVEKYLSHYYSPNTHLTGEALGLVYVGTLLPELDWAKRFRDLGAQILLAESARQVHEDGVYFEQSTCYQRYTVEILLHFLILSQRNGAEVPSALGPTVERMLDFLLSLQLKDGSTLAIGDADGGSLLPLAERGPDDMRGVFSTAAALFERSDYAWAAGGLAPETLWLLGEKGARAFETLAPACPKGSPSQIFPVGGYAVMSSGWKSDAHRVLFDVGPLGCPVSAGHGHADLLSVHCSVFGEPFLVDAGTYTYTSEPEWREYFRGTHAHSTVTVDGKGQAESKGPFAWASHPRARLLRWESREAFDLAEAEHDAYATPGVPLRHRRRVLFRKPDRFVIVDDLEGLGEHEVDVRYQFAPLPVALEGPGAVRAMGRGGRALRVEAFSRAHLERQLFDGTVQPIQGWVSSQYGCRRAAPTLVYSTRALLPVRIVTLLLPLLDPEAPPPRVQPLWDKTLELVGLSIGDERPLFLEPEAPGGRD